MKRKRALQREKADNTRKKDAVPGNKKVPAKEETGRKAKTAAVSEKEAVGTKPFRIGFDTIGGIAIIDSKISNPESAAKYIMDTHKNIVTVLGKGGPVEGKYRKRKYTYITGKRSYTTIHKENGCSFMLDVRKVYFSPRLAYERKRIVDLSKEGEKVVVMFSGVGPFAIEIAKKNRNSEVVGIEMNSEGHKYAVMNRELNKTWNFFPVLGDAGSPPRKYLGFADRILMPLPMDSERFLEAAFRIAGKRCVMHYYAFVEDGGKEALKKLKLLSVKKSRKFKLLGKREVRPYSADISEIVINFQIAKTNAAKERVGKHSEK